VSYKPQHEIEKSPMVIKPSLLNYGLFWFSVVCLGVLGFVPHRQPTMSDTDPVPLIHPLFLLSLPDT
jgi:hypothetical protein